MKALSILILSMIAIGGALLIVIKYYDVLAAFCEKVKNSLGIYCCKEKSFSQCYSDCCSDEEEFDSIEN